MKLDITSSGDFDKAIRWLETAPKKKPERDLRSIGEKGVRNLQQLTPKDTGGTAMGWRYRVESTKEGSELYFFNTANPGSRANVAMLIQLGHGTATGGYVPPVDYIRPALRKLMNTAGDRLAKEMFK